MKEITSLMERAMKYIESSNILLEKGDYESSVSRAYYAMFYAVEALLLTKELSFSSHKGVISAFGEHFVKTNIFSKDMSRELNRAFEKRQFGDYAYTFVIAKAEAEEILKGSKNFVEKTTRYLKETRFL